MKRLSSILAAPLACIALLGGITLEKSTLLKPADAEPYHQAARVAIDAIPRHIGTWYSQDVRVPTEAIQLLHPNSILSREYTDTTTGHKASLLVVQCKEAGDMSGHWPPNCYVNSGEEMNSALTHERNWAVSDLVLPGIEYHFLSTTSTQSRRHAVYNFLIVPGKGVVRDMDGVKLAARDYLRRNFGAGQFQVLVDDDLPQAERDAIFTTLMEPCIPAIKTLMMLPSDKAASPTGGLTAGATALNQTPTDRVQPFPGGISQ